MFHVGINMLHVDVARSQIRRQDTTLRSVVRLDLPENLCTGETYSTSRFLHSIKIKSDWLVP